MKDRVVFVHMEKCGGGSVRRLLFEAAKRAKVTMHIPCFTAPCSAHLAALPPEDLARFKDLRPQLVADHSPYLFTNHAFDLPVSATWHFTLLRDPIARLVSHFAYFHRPKAEVFRDASINEYPIDLLRDYALHFSWFYAAKLAHRFVRSNDDRAVPVNLRRDEAILAARGAIEELDFVGFLDLPDEFVAGVSDRNPLGLTLDRLPHDRVGSYEPLEPGRRAMVEEILQPDVRLYDQARSIWGAPRQA